MRRLLRRIRNIRVYVLSAAVVMAATLTIPMAIAAAADVRIDQVKVTHWSVSSQVLPAPDEKGHMLAVGQREGEAVFRDGNTAKYNSTVIADLWMGKKGLLKGYTRFSFEDGSNIFFSWTADSIQGKDGLPGAKGTGTIIRGTGRFEGIQGTVVFNNTQLKPTAEDPKRTAETDAVFVYTLP